MSVRVNGHVVHLHDVRLVCDAVNKDGMMVDSDAVLSCDVIGSYSLGDDDNDVDLSLSLLA